jgi:hypothetical protein
LDGSAIAFHSRDDHTGKNPDESSEIFLATCSKTQPTAIPVTSPLGIIVLAIVILIAGVRRRLTVYTTSVPPKKWLPSRGRQGLDLPTA